MPGASRIAAAASLALALALAVAPGCARRADQPAPAARDGGLILASLEGRVETAPDGGVVVSTASEDVRVEPPAAADALRRLPGRTVALHGWLVDERWRRR